MHTAEARVRAGRESVHDVHLEGLLETAARRALEQELSAEFTASKGGAVAVVVCDLDRFGRVNEALGYEAGNALIRLVAERLRDASSRWGRVAWIGGDQFMIVLPALRSPDELSVVAERLRTAMQLPAELEGTTVYPSGTFGLAWRTGASARDDAVGADLMRLAEADLYRKKAQRRSRSAPEVPHHLLQLDTDLHGAVERGELVAHFQPIYETQSCALAAFEVLARWTHPTLGAVPPDAFIAIAEDNGLIHDIGTHMLRAARSFLEGAHEWRPALYVNVSTEQLARAGFAEHVADVFSGDPSMLSRLTLEITETSLIVDRGRVTAELAALRGLGVGLAVDDFGSGYSSLLQLQELPVTELKIDRALVQHDGAVGHAVLQAVVQLASGLGLTVVAEGIEQIAQLQLMQRLGCDRVQGYLFSPAVPPDLARAIPAAAFEAAAAGTPAPAV
ncbi:putative bifunctional diguanylate cyclase/phosphodiesterase [Amnibacterium kyonggiense]